MLPFPGAFRPGSGPRRPLRFRSWPGFAESAAVTPLLSGMATDTRVRFIRFQDQVYQFNGRNRMRAFTGAEWRLAGIDKPTGVFSSAAGSAGVLTGTYKYYITAANQEIIVGDGSNRFVESLPVEVAELTVSASQINVTLPGTHSDSQVTHHMIYRNKDGQYDSNLDDVEQDFFLVASVPIGTTNYADNIADDSLPTSLEFIAPFKTEVPPCFKYAAVYAGHLFGAGFDDFTAGSATVDQSDKTKINFTVVIPDGLRGCFFRKIGETKKYEIASVSGTSEITLTEAFVGNLNADDYAIYQDPSVVWHSELGNAEAGGEESAWNQLLIGGPGSKLKITGIFAAHGVLYVFTLDQVYRIYGKPGYLNTSPDPVLDSLGCVSGDGIFMVDDVMYWLSLQAPVGYNPNATSSNQVQRIGRPLGVDWAKDTAPAPLNSSELGLSVGEFDPAINCCVWYCPLSGENENGYGLMFHIETGTWWPIENWGPTCVWRDYDSNGKPRLYSAVARKFFIESENHNDGVPSGDKSAIVTSYDSTNKIITCSAAAFNNTGYGLESLWAHVYRKTTGSDVYDTYVGKSKIASNTPTTLTLDDAISTPAANDIVYIGPVVMRWTTKTFAFPEGNQKMQDAEARFALQGESTPSVLFYQTLADQTALSGFPGLTVDKVDKSIPIQHRGPELTLKLEVRQPDAEVALRSLTVETDKAEQQE